jgi:hypothetical protein
MLLPGDEAKLTFVFANVSSVNTSNLDVIPGAIPSKPGLIRVVYARYMDGTRAISAMARLSMFQSNSH